MHQQGITILPVIFALLVAVALLALLQRQQQASSLQQANLVISERAKLVAGAAGEWVAFQILADHQANPGSQISCPSDLSFSDAAQPEYQVTLSCTERYYDNAANQQFDLNIEVQFSTLNSADYMKQQFNWVISL